MYGRTVPPGGLQIIHIHISLSVISFNGISFLTHLCVEGVPTSGLINHNAQRYSMTVQPLVGPKHRRVLNWPEISAKRSRGREEGGVAMRKIVVLVVHVHAGVSVNSTRNQWWTGRESSPEPSWLRIQLGHTFLTSLDNLFKDSSPIPLDISLIDSLRERYMDFISLSITFTTLEGIFHFISQVPSGACKGYRGTSVRGPTPYQFISHLL